MPNYGIAQAGGQLTDLKPGESLALFNAETPTPAQASIAFSRGPSPAFDDAGITFSVICGGTFSCQIQGANVDAAANYQNLGSAITASPGSYTDINRFKFYRVNVTALTGGSITVIAQR